MDTSRIPLPRTVRLVQLADEGEVELLWRDHDLVVANVHHRRPRASARPAKPSFRNAPKPPSRVLTRR